MFVGLDGLYCFLHGTHIMYAYYYSMRPGQVGEKSVFKLSRDEGEKCKFRKLVEIPRYWSMVNMH